MNSLPPQSRPAYLEDEYPDLWSHIETERVALYEGLGWDANAATTYEPHTDASQFLLGNCHMNATELAARLDDAGYNPVLVLGILSFSGEPDPDPPSEPGGAARTSNFHAWIELPDYADDGLVVEVATEWSDAPGLPYISPERPPEYRVPLQGRFEYESWMTHEIVGVETSLEEFQRRATPLS